MREQRKNQIVVANQLLEAKMLVTRLLHQSAADYSQNCSRLATAKAATLAMQVTKLASQTADAKSQLVAVSLHAELLHLQQR